MKIPVVRSEVVSTTLEGKEAIMALACQWEFDGKKAIVLEDENCISISYTKVGYLDVADGGESNG